MNYIPINEIKFHSHSFFDPAGRLFWWNGELYRGMYAEWAPFYARLFEEGLIQKLIDQGLLIETELTPLMVDGYDMVVRHRTVPFLSYPNEWCPSMFKRGALATLHLEIELAQSGLTLKDARPWNLLFDGCTAVHVDLTSIAPIEALPNQYLWPSYEDFCQFWLHPLILMSKGQDQIVRRLQWAGDGILSSDLSRLTGVPKISTLIASLANWLKSIQQQKVSKQYRERINRNLKAVRTLFCQTRSCSPKSRIKFLQEMRVQIENIRLPSRSNKYAFSSLTRSQFLKSTHRILRDLNPSSILDIGCNTGEFSKLGSDLGSNVVSFDINPIWVERLHRTATKNNLRILPLVMDFIKPTPSCGPSDHWSIAANKRFQCEMVLAIGVLHTFVRDLYFEQIVEGLESFSKRWLIVEFISSDNPETAMKWWSHRVTPWYTLDNFINALQKRFRTITIVDSFSHSHVLLLCEK